MFVSDYQTVTIVVLIVVILVSLLHSVLLKQDAPLRPMPALRHWRRWISLNVERGVPSHFSVGAAAPGSGATQLSVIATRVAQTMYRGSLVSYARPIITAQLPQSFPALTNTWHGLYDEIERISFMPVQVRWQPGEDPTAFAASLMTLGSDDRAGTHILHGRFDQDIALLLWSAGRRGTTSSVATDALSGQAVAWSMADFAILGEDSYVIDSYPPRANPLNAVTDLLRRSNLYNAGRGRAATLDIMRLVIIGTMLVLFVLSTIDTVAGGR